MAQLVKTDKNIPLYIQIKELLKKRISNGEIKGSRLPPIRKMAHDMGVSVNTVLRAYEQLRKDGIVSGTVGRGTFLSPSPQELSRANRENMLMKMIEHSLEEALSLGFTIDEFETAVGEFIKDKLDFLRDIHLSFIECNIEQITYFSEHLELDPQIHIHPLLIDELRAPDAALKAQIREKDIFVTSFYHLEEVRNRLGFLNRPIIGINLEPEVKTIVEVAKIPSESTVGLVTTSRKFITIIEEVLEDLNLKFDRVLKTNSKSKKKIGELVNDCYAVLVSPKQKRIVDEQVGKATKVIEFAFAPDRTSINNLKVAIFDLKNDRIIE